MKNTKEGVQDIINNGHGMFDTFQTGPDIYGYMMYYNGAYNYMMKIVNEYILKKETGNPAATFSYGVLPMKYRDFRYDGMAEYFGIMISIIVVVAYMVPLSLYVYRMVKEKESKTKEGMKIMGLGEGEYFLSYFIQYTVISIFVSLINAFLFKVVYPRIPIYFLYFIIFLYSLNVFALIYFFQSIIDKTKIAIVLSLIIYCIMFCLSLACMFEKASFFFKIILAIFPAVNLSIGISLISKFEFHFRSFYNKDFMKEYVNYSLFYLYAMFFIDFFLYLFLGFYFQHVLPHDFGIRKPWYFLCTKNFWCKDKKKSLYKKNKLLGEDFNPEELARPSRPSRFESEQIYEDKTEDDIFEVKNIVKVFGDGKRAVNGVSLKFYKDEIFALLGHNGAGKTTLISILTGMYEATSGTAMFSGHNVLDSNNMDLFREKLGICPQHDTLFEDLTVKEHLEMFSIFKGVKKEEVGPEVNKTLRDFQIENIGDMLAKNLSAGQRRKLSIAISLIGGSQVIFLDEPSSGMDITSRRNLWEILKRQCDGKIIIITTHYMEEASVLGKRIGIINAGRMKCIGSPLFLIEKYGKYMSLNITKEEDADNNEIIDFVKSLSENVQYEVLSEEIMFRIPIKDDPINDIKLKEKLNIQNFFLSFDESMKSLKIKSYSVSMPTLEDVFLNVAEESNKKTKEEKNLEMLREQQNDKVLFSSDLRENYTAFGKFRNDFLISCKRRYLITKRDIKGFLMEVLAPILLVLFGLLISKFDMDFRSKPYLVNLGLTGKQTLIYTSLNKKDYTNYLKKEDGLEIESIDLYDFSKIDNTSDYKKITKDSNINSTTLYREYSAKKFIERVYNITDPYEDSENHEVDMTAENYPGYYSSLLMFSEQNNRYEFLMVLNSRVRHCIPIYSNYILSSIIKSASKNKNVTINYTHYPMPLTEDVKEQNSIGNNIAITFFIAIAFAIMPANFISLLVKERSNNSKHLMRVSGINILSYWIVNYIFEFIKYYITAGICIILLVMFNFYRQYLYIMYLIYGPAMISLTYALSFFFTDESNAQNAVILLNFVLGDLGSIVILILRMLPNMKSKAIVMQYIFSLIPTFCFDFSYNLLLNKMNIYGQEFEKKDYIRFTGNEMIKEPKLMLPLIIFCSVECFAYTILFAVLEKFSYSFKKPKYDVLISNINDEEVQKEIERANSATEAILPYNLLDDKEDDTIIIEPKKKGEYDSSIVKVKNLKKVYGKNCINRKGNVAINNLHFCLEPGECFGLLGLNGAGKTTTFKCITQEIAPDNGQILVYGKDINGRFDELTRVFGYCPQFDAIFEYLTVYENLEFYARIKGIRRELIHQLITFMIMEMSLTEFTNKISGRLSGGNKRKLSVAISMLGNPPIILLDEPSTGMDPEARRFMWSVIHKMSTKGRKSSVIMTTHSMDEAETLCRRMGIMVNGEFVCLGTANQIKDKYGYGYEVDVRIKPMSMEKQKEILDQYNLDYDLKIDHNNLQETLNKLDKSNYYDELREGRLGEKIRKAININNEINIGVLLNWVFFVENALKFISKAKEYFTRIILSEHIENNFLFKLKKNNNTKSIGFFFGLFEENKEECFVTEYSIQQTSLEQIFNKFAANQGKPANEIDENEDILKHENKSIIIDDELLNKLIN